jgi:hypothetical protein
MARRNLSLLLGLILNFAFPGMAVCTAIPVVWEL